MARKVPTRDPIAAYRRKAVAVRRVGQDKHCACGESRPEALIAGSNPIICAACDRERRGKAPLDGHHVASRSNSPVTIPVPVNDHRARLSTDQYDWPRETLENPHGSPLRAAAARIRGFADVLYYLIEKLVLGIPEILEEVDAFLVKTRGPKWWIGTPMEKYAKKR
jgi:hypothetical protein